MKSLILCLLTLTTSLANSQDKIKIITITKTNNDAILLIKNEFVLKNETQEYLKDLYSFISEKGFKVDHQSEFSDIKKSLAWVTSQWSHDGMNEPEPNSKALDILKSVYKDKKQYRCVEYGIVLSDVLQSIGFSSRTIAMRSNNVAYGGFGQGHVAMEVWSNEFNKWIFLDPQFGVYLTAGKNDIPLNYYEAFLEKKSKRWNAIVVHSAKDAISSKDQKEYKEFLKNYFGHISVSSGKDQPKISLHLENKNNPITFQGQPDNNNIFTNDYKVFYPLMNAVTLQLSYSGTQPNFQNLIKELKIQNDNDYLKNMHHFAAIPNYNVMMRSTMHLLKGFEYRLSKNEEWRFIKENQISWSATNETNYLEVRAVNEMDRKGPSTYIELQYK